MLRWTRWVDYCLPSLILGSVLLAGCGAKVNAPPEAPQAVRRGDEAYRYRDYEAAIQQYRAHTELIEKDEYTARALYKSALSQFHLGRYREAIQSLDDLHRRYPDARWVQVEALRGDTERALGHSDAAIEAWDRAWRVGSDSDRSKLRVRIATVARSMNNSELAEAHENAKAGDVREMLEDQIAKRAKPELNEPMPEFQGGIEPDEAMAPAAAVKKPTSTKTITSPGEQPAPVAAEEKSAKATAETEAWSVPPQTSADKAAAPAPAVAPPAAPPASPIAQAKLDASSLNPNTPTKNPKVAVILPVTGLEAAAGGRALDAIRLVFDPKQIVIRDTGDTAAAGLRDFVDLAKDPDVLAAIGPLDEETTGEVAPKAFALHLPLITLSSADDESRPYVVQAGVAPQQLVGKLLDYSMGRVRLRRFGVVYPDEPSGETFVSAFKAQVGQRGGTIVGTDAYAVDAKTLAAGKVRRWRDKENMQALVLPDGVRAATAFAHFLQREMPDILLLGASNWDPLVESDQALNGVVFASAFSPNSQRPAAKEFVGRYEHTYGRTPGSIEAESYDAALILRRALESGAHSRADVWEKLQATQGVDGATGSLVVSPSGVTHDVRVVQVVDGKLVELEAPTDSGQVVAGQH